jgi:hypothetical protein
MLRVLGVRRRLVQRPVDLGDLVASLPTHDLDKCVQVRR